MFQYGKQKNLNSKKNNKLKSSNEDFILLECFDSLKKAKKIAKQTQNVEAYLMISDRWVNIYSVLSSGESPKYDSIGFTANIDQENL